jgi:hypothetical protein
MRQILLSLFVSLIKNGMFSLKFISIQWLDLSFSVQCPSADSSGFVLFWWYEVC